MDTTQDREMIGVAMRMMRRSLREDMSQQLLAERSGVSTNMIARLESGASGVPAAKVRGILRVMGKDFADLQKILDQIDPATTDSRTS